MKKRILICLVMLTTANLLELKAQSLKLTPKYSDCSPLKFNGIAPAPWAIDGKMDDWQTLLGTGTGDPVWPFAPALGQNAYYDSYGTADPDHPDPQIDLRVLSNIRDDYNVYFYFRRLGKPNHPNKIFYFFDINLDGRMNVHEPVLCVNFKNSQKISSLSIGKYIPQNLIGDTMATAFFCIPVINNKTLEGNVTEFINSETVTLLPNEKFEAAITEKGFGVEIAIPWRFINPADKYFAYRVALQQGSGMYSPGEPTDNASCQNLVEIIGSPDFTVLNTVTSTIIPGFSYRITVTLKNLTPYTQVYTVADSVIIKNIIQNNNLPVNETQFTVAVNSQTYRYLSGTFIHQPIIYTGFGARPEGLPQIALSPFGTGSFIIDIGFPPNGSVKSAKLEFNPKAFFSYLNWIGDFGCGLVDGCCGKPINPIGIEIGEISETKVNHNPGSFNEESNYQNKLYVFPNPSNGTTNVVIPVEMGEVEITVTDYMGKMIRRLSGIRQKIFSISNLKPGLYMLNIKSSNGKMTATKKLLVK